MESAADRHQTQYRSQLVVEVVVYMCFPTYRRFGVDYDFRYLHIVLYMLSSLGCTNARGGGGRPSRHWLVLPVQYLHALFCSASHSQVPLFRGSAYSDA